ncbi:nuclear transport factor 2 [Acrasis kona]|uniref:Nuclear transport factor 2 n=1 Tax=Acrasis kona TaxID=1008807 RepID=A0AAW2YV40_9EUKA
MSNFQQVGKAFVEHYHQTFDQNRQNVAALYQEQSMLTWEDEQIMGSVNILKKMGQLTFRSAIQELIYVDCQPSLSGGIIVFTAGLMNIDKDQTQRFSEVFHLAKANNSFYISNHLFRLQF